MSQYLCKQHMQHKHLLQSLQGLGVHSLCTHRYNLLLGLVPGRLDVLEWNSGWTHLFGPVWCDLKKKVYFPAWGGVSAWLSTQSYRRICYPSTWLFLTLHYPTLDLLHSIEFYHGSTSFYMSVHYSTSTLALLHSTMALFTLLDSTTVLLHSTWLCFTLQ